MMVAIRFGEGFAICEQCEKLNGENLKVYRENFLREFKNLKKSNSLMWLQDNDPSKNNGLAHTAMSKIGAD